MDNNIDAFNVCVRIRPLLNTEKKDIEKEKNKKPSIPTQIVSSRGNVVILKELLLINRFF